MPYKDKALQQNYQNNWRQQRRLQWIADHGPCRQCGSFLRLEVDHIDPSTKVDHNVWSWAQKRRENELAKCQVLCHSCHKSKTVAALRKPVVHGTMSGYKSYYCRCELCKAANTKYERVRRKGGGVL
jgi:hypothetical protein